MEVESPVLCESGPKTGMVTDFGDIKKAVAPLLESRLDHQCPCSPGSGVRTPVRPTIPARLRRSRQKPESGVDAMKSAGILPAPLFAGV